MRATPSPARSPTRSTRRGWLWRRRCSTPVGVYPLTERGPNGYTAGLFSCSGGGALAGNLLTIAAADAGNTITCTITNTFNPPRLALAKTVLNTGGRLPADRTRAKRLYGWLVQLQRWRRVGR